MTIFTLLIFIFSLLLIYYVLFLLKIKKGLDNVSQSVEILKNSEFISVIIPFRNEKENLEKSLSSIISQSLPKNQYEVIYIDDNSDDSSYEILKEITKPDNIRVLKSPSKSEQRGHKKIALKHAIDNSKGTIIVTTDADCTHHKDWLLTMVTYFNESTGFVSGPVQFVGKERIFDKLQELEFSGLILTGAGLIGSNFPIICNAANLAFRKSAYDKVGGYSDNLLISSGDDEFLMQKISRQTEYDVKFCFDSKAISYTGTNNSFEEFYNQRKRWASKGFHYVDKKITLNLILIYLFFLSIPVQLFLGFANEILFLLTAIITLVVKAMIEFLIVSHKGRELFEKPKLSTFIIAEIFHVPYIIISGFSGIFGNYQWKNRNIAR